MGASASARAETPDTSARAGADAPAPTPTPPLQGGRALTNAAYAGARRYCLRPHATQASRRNAQHMFGSTFGIGDHFAIPEPDDAPTALLEPPRPGFVAVELIEMLRPIKLNAQHRLPAGKIEDRAILDTQLPRPSRPITRQELPQFAFGRRCFAAKLPGSFRHMLRNTPAHHTSVARRTVLAYPPPTPPFQGGEQITQTPSPETAPPPRNAAPRPWPSRSPRSSSSCCAVAGWCGGRSPPAQRR